MRHADTSHYSGNIVRINQPALGAEASEQVINLGPGHLVQFTCGLSDFIFDRSANDLVLKYPQGSSLTMRSFFSEDGSELPDFMLKDGTILPGNDFLAIMELAVSAQVDTAFNDIDPSQSSGLNFMLDFDNVTEESSLDALFPHNIYLQPVDSHALFAGSNWSDSEFDLMTASSFNDFSALNDAAAFAEQSAMLSLLLSNG
jgi:hypothetical protein